MSHKQCHIAVQEYHLMFKGILQCISFHTFLCHGDGSVCRMTTYLVMNFRSKTDSILLSYEVQYSVLILLMNCMNKLTLLYQIFRGDTI